MNKTIKKWNYRFNSKQIKKIELLPLLVIQRKQVHHKPRLAPRT